MADGLLPTLLLNPRLGRVSLVELVNSPRVALLGKYDSYARSTQYEGRRYNWDGAMLGYGEQADISPGWYVPLQARKPSARLDLPKLITQRLSAFAVGSERWPQIQVAGDAAAEDYARALCEAASLPAKILEARQKGGACGTACVSFKFVQGQPRVMVHDARNMHVMRWADRDELVIGAVLKAYAYPRTVWDETGKAKQITLYSVRYWDETEERVWDPITEAQARRGDWVTSVQSYSVAHGFGECPVYWCQNLPDSEQEDGQSDFEGLPDQFDRINETLSATLKGTVANVDPTLVINDDPGANPGVIRKGSGSAIYSKGGADYLELAGTAVESGLAVVDRLAQMCLDLAGVVVADPKDLASKATSAAALKILFQPQIAVCDVLRSQYGGLIRRLVLGMLRAARLVATAPEGPVVVTADGHRIQQQAVINLPSRFEKQDGKDVELPRVPGTSENLALVWPPYFEPTAADVTGAVTSAKTARGVTISQRTAVRYTAPLFGVTDVEAELAEIEVEREAEMNELIRQAQQSNPPDPAALDDDEG